MDKLPTELLLQPCPLSVALQACTATPSSHTHSRAWECRGRGASLAGCPFSEYLPFFPLDQLLRRRRAWPLVVQAHVAYSSHLGDSILCSRSQTGWTLVRENPRTSGRCPRWDRLSSWGTCSLEVLRAMPVIVVEQLADPEAHIQGDRWVLDVI